MRRLLLPLLLAGTAVAGGDVDLAAAREKVRELEREVAAVVEKVAPAVGAVVNHGVIFNPKTGQVVIRPRGMGSGLVVTKDGLMLTNVHVVQGAGHITVALPGGTYPAVLVADTSKGQVKGDIALLQLKGRDRWPYVDYRKGDTKRLVPGTFVLAMGNPHGLALDGTPVVTMGIVSGKGRSASETGYLYIDSIQTDAEINPGNSGGPLFDMKGHYLGINGLMSSRQGRSNSGVGFAIPVDQVRLFMKQLQKSGGENVGYGYHGLHVKSSPNESGALVTRVDAYSPAAAAGLKPNDVIIRTKGKRVRNRTEFVNIVGRLPEKAVVAVMYRRGSNTRTTKFKLVSYAKWKATTSSKLPPKPLPLTERGYLGAEFKEGRAGVFLTRIVPGAAAERAGLKKDDRLIWINENEVRTAAEVVHQLSLTRAGDEASVRYAREDRKQTVKLVLSDVAEAAGIEH